MPGRTACIAPNRCETAANRRPLRWQWFCASAAVMWRARPVCCAPPPSAVRCGLAKVQCDHALNLFSFFLTRAAAVLLLLRNAVPDLFAPSGGLLCLAPACFSHLPACLPACPAAWNTVTHGRKLWIVLRPECPEHIAKGSKFMSNNNKRGEPDIEEARPVSSRFYSSYVFPRPV